MGRAHDHVPRSIYQRSLLLGIAAPDAFRQTPAGGHHLIAGLTIAPGVKFVSFNRDINAASNQGTQLPLDYSKTYTATTPTITVNYQASSDVTVYAQAAMAFVSGLSLRETPSTFSSDMKYVSGVEGTEFREALGPGFGSAADSPLAAARGRAGAAPGTV